jgi:potassium channel subfamily K
MIGAVVFWKSEKNQSWSYFESIYFSYTTLLTIGYGDFQPESNSGKPFFVFWSLLAVPTLTILISNMGDTVIQLIKDLTIWLGEVTVLPSEAGSIRQSLKFGITKLTGGKIDVQGIRDSDDNIEDTPPGLVRMPQRRKQQPRHNKQDVENAQQLASEFEKAEQMDEDEARRKGDQISEDIHHYRHLLIKEVQNVYADVNSSEPKKYSYEEWSYFLQLLGEDEGNPKYHRKAPLMQQNTDLKKSTDDSTAVMKEEQEVDSLDDAGQKHPTPEGLENDRTGEKIKKWSWIGNRSPLMGDQDEAEWVLEKLFARLEDELQRERKLAKKLKAKKEKETDKKQDTPRWPLRLIEDQGKHLPVHDDDHDDDDDDKSRESSRTLEGQASREEKDSRPTSSEDEKDSGRLSVEEGKDPRPPRI